MRSAAVPHARRRHYRFAPDAMPQDVTAVRVPGLLVSALVNARALAHIFSEAGDSAAYRSAGQFVSDALLLLAGAGTRVHDLSRDLERASGAVPGAAPVADADLLMAQAHADLLIHDLASIRRWLPFTWLRKAADRGNALQRAARIAGSLASSLVGLGIDAAGADLTSISAENPRYLAGVIWDEGTRWPAGLTGWVSQHSRELGSGRRQVTDSDDPSAAQAMPVLLISLRYDGRRLARTLATALDLASSSDLASNPALAADLAETFADARNRALDLAAALERGLAQARPRRLARRARRLAIDLKSASEFANELTEPTRARAHGAASALSVDAEKARDTARDLASELLLLPADASGIDLSSIDIDAPDLLDGVTWTEQTKWPAPLARWVREHSEEISQGLYRVTHGTEREEATPEPQGTPAP